MSDNDAPTYNEMIKTGLDRVSDNVNAAGSLPWNDEIENLRGIRHLLNAQIVLQSTLLTHLAQMDDRLETIEDAVSRFDQRERHG